MALSGRIIYNVVDTICITDSIPLIDLIACRCSFLGYQFNLVLVYIPPDISCTDFELFFDALSLLLFTISILLVGVFNVPDFNNNLAHQINTKVDILSEFYNLHDLKQVNNIVNTNGRLFDLVFGNLEGEILVCHEDSPAVLEDSHHPALFISYQLSRSVGVTHFSQSCTFRYDFCKANYPQIINDINNFDWSILNSYSVVNFSSW